MGRAKGVRFTPDQVVAFCEGYLDYWYAKNEDGVYTLWHASQLIGMYGTKARARNAIVREFERMVIGGNSNDVSGLNGGMGGVGKPRCADGIRDVNQGTDGGTVGPTNDGDRAPECDGNECGMGTPGGAKGVSKRRNRRAKVGPDADTVTEGNGGE